MFTSQCIKIHDRNVKIFHSNFMPYIGNISAIYFFHLLLTNVLIVSRFGLKSLLNALNVNVNPID